MIDIFLEKERIVLIVINLEELILAIFHVVGSELYKRDCTPCAVMEIISITVRIVEKRRRSVTLAPWRQPGNALHIHFNFIAL